MAVVGSFQNRSQGSPLSGSCAHVWTPPLVWAGHNDSLLMNRIRQKWWMALWGQVVKDCNSSLFLFLSPWFACSDKASCHVASCPTERPIQWATESGIQVTASEELKPLVHQVVKNWLLPTTMHIEMLQTMLTSWLLLCEILKLEDPAKLCPDFWPTQTVRWWMLFI